METEAKVSSGVTVVGSDAPSSYELAPRSDVITGKLTGAPAPKNQVVGPIISLHGSSEVKKKRGRPRKYGPGGPYGSVAAVDFDDKPISVAAPVTAVIDFTAQKRPKLKPITTTTTTVMKQHDHHHSASAGETILPCAVGANFTPHIITVTAGEDVTMKVISFSQQGPRAICILSANGVISSVTLRQPDSSGGTLTYEGRFEILSLTGSFMPSESGGIRNRSGGLSVSLASPDGRVIGGGVAGLLVAASPVQIVVGSFLAGNQHEQKPKKQISEFLINASPALVIPVSSISMQDTNGAQGLPTSGMTHLSFQNDTRNGSTESLHED